MKKTPLISIAAIAVALFAGAAQQTQAQVITRGGANASGGVTGGQRVNAYGPYGERAVGERGVVTNGNGGGVAGGRGCAYGAAGGGACGKSAAAWDSSGNYARQSDAVYAGPFGGTGYSSGSVTRDSSGDINGSRTGEYSVGDRTYSVNTSAQTGEGVDRSASCSGSGCR